MAYSLSSVVITANLSEKRQQVQILQESEDYDDRLQGKQQHWM